MRGNLGAGRRSAPKMHEALSKSGFGRGVRRWLRESTALTRRLHFETFEPRVLLSADLIPIQGEIEVPGEIDRYAFSLTEPKRIYFDSQTNDGNLNWSLTGPQGTEVSQRSIQNSDSIDFTGNPVLDLASGDYTLSIDGVGAATGNYTFRLLDLGNATPITPGTPVSESLDPANETDLYQFDVTGGRYEERDYATSGSGSLHASTVLKLGFRNDMDADAAIDLALRALWHAADEDSATGGPDPIRGIYPIVATIDSDGFSKVAEEHVAERVAVLTDGLRGVDSLGADQEGGD